MIKNAQCIFCDTPEDRILIAQPLAYATEDGFPVSPGHTLIIPRRRVASFFELNIEPNLRCPDSS
jgi:ATP adenylyltransferase